jgi:hypothetical protein
MLFPCLLLNCLTCLQEAWADSLIFSKGDPMSGIVLQTNNEEVLFLTDFGAMRFALASLKSIKIDQAEAAEPNWTNRIPNFRTLLSLLSRQSWATNLEPIPATVIETGMLRYVPYVSFRCADDYEVNIYGDLAQPAGIEVGVYRKLVTDFSARTNCLNLVTAALGQTTDKQIIPSLNLEKDQKVLAGLTFEITPPTDPDAYLGWWISVYDEANINNARASEEEMKRISVSKQELTSQAQVIGSWTKEEAEKARPYYSATPAQNISTPQDNSYSTPSSYTPPSYSSGGRSTSSSYSGGGRVYVRGYTRKNGTYVQPHTRSAPHRR